MNNFKSIRRKVDDPAKSVANVCESPNRQIPRYLDGSTGDGGSDENLKNLVRPETNYSTRRKIDRDRFGFDDYDESQHVPGCPLKWFYDKKLSERKRIQSTYRHRGFKCASAADDGRYEGNRRTNVRIPADMKIHKINLVNKHSRIRTKNSFMVPINKSFGKETDVGDVDRINLTAKFNWKLDDISRDDDSLGESFPELSFRQNYFPPRPLPGTKPLLTILLFPNGGSKCCVSNCRGQSDSSSKGGDMALPTLSVKSLDLPVPTSNERSLNSKKITRLCRSTLRRSSLKTSKRHQIPNRVTINLRETKPETNRKTFLPISAKRLNKHKIKDETPLTSLVYKLSGKSNNRKEDRKTLEDLMRDMEAEDDEEFKFRKFFYYKTHEADERNAPEEVESAATVENLSEKLQELPADLAEMHLTCGKARIFEKPPKKRK